ncbi:synaptogyrin-1a [Eucyclogobius newberryi]|uniref:synaptogyrin-1a n=1 Tax=Eucyclogobius newberryi TaxID=166745 RepID=UPI003B5BC465
MEGYGLKTGGAFDLMTFLKQPITALRLFSWIFSVVVLACISNEGFLNSPDSPLDLCVFNGNANACRLGQGAGSVALLVCTAFIAVDLHFPQISSVRDRKRVVLADILLSGLWSVLWFVCFCFLANQWQISSLENPLGEGADAARATILFCFFSIFSWGGLTLLSLERMKRVSFEEEYNKLFTPQT